ncbi:MAG: alpha-E domain-containing protein [Thauera sp.]|nr:alpha-E domain-containing protein [Thauera sp.]
MLSRVAERLYWMARYVERAENTSRMIMAFNTLALDMPRSVSLSWRELVTVTGMDTLFDERYQRDDDRNCVKFLIADAWNPGSILSTLRSARENVRTTRDLVPTEGWEVVNELYLFARDNAEQGVNKRGRHDFLSEIVQRCQTLTGLLAGCMSHDAAYDFIRLGHNIERADMATRQIDVGALRLLAPREAPSQYEGLLWTSILRSQSAFQMYRQHVKRRVGGVDVMRFLLQDPDFPRSVAYALSRCEHALSRLPHNERPLHLAIAARRHTLEADVATLVAGNGLHDFMDRVQLEVADLHTAIASEWFPQDTA